MPGRSQRDIDSGQCDTGVGRAERIAARTGSHETRIPCEGVCFRRKLRGLHAGAGGMHGDMRGRGSHRRASHSGHSSTLCGSDRGEYREGSNCNQEAAHVEYLGSRAAGPFLHVHV